MSDRFVVGVALGRWQTNCFVVGDLARGECVVIDPGEGGATTVPSILDQLGVRCTALLVTHGHLDHFWAVPELAKRLDVPIRLHPDDRWLWDNPAAGFGVGGEDAVALLRAQFGLEWDASADRIETLADGDCVTYAGIDFEVRHTPGHTPGHVTFLGRDLAGAQVQFALARADAATPDVLFSGDLIFAGSVGRTDFPRGSTEDLLRSIVDTVLPLEDDILILSGHGQETTVGRERRTNPFVAQAIDLFG